MGLNHIAGAAWSESCAVISVLFCFRTAHLLIAAICLLLVQVRCLYDVLFSKLDADTKVAGPLKDAVPLLKATASDARGQLAQLLALEWLLAVGAPDRVKEGALALKVLYDEDLAEEEIILEWASRKDAAKVLGVDAEGAKAVRAAVAPVVDWLQEADDSSEEESEEDE